MIKILFVCHGNICRSPMAEFVLKDMVRQEGIAEQFLIQSAATSTEEIWNGIGNPVYPPAREELRKHGISCEGKRAVQVTKKDYGKYDYIFGMDQRNMRNMLRIFGGDPAGKVRPLLEMAGRRGDIADPWYTGNFQLTYSDIEESCKGFLQYLRENGKING
nr:low molecular weight protein-tyrosine-phosphatase [uncultured Blautia sp.]